MKPAGTLLLAQLCLIVVVQAHSNGFCYNANPCNGEVQVALSAWHLENTLGSVYFGVECLYDDTKLCSEAVVMVDGQTALQYAITNMLDNAGGVPDAPGWTAANCDRCDDDDDASSRSQDVWQVATAKNSFSPPVVPLSPGQHSFIPVADNNFATPSYGECWPALVDIEFPVAYTITCPASQIVEQSSYPTCSALNVYPQDCPALFSSSCVFVAPHTMLTGTKVATFADATCAEVAPLCPGSVCSVDRESGQASTTSFPLGSTVVDWALEVDAVKTGPSCSHSVVVTDTTAPQNLVCSPPVTTTCTSSSGAPVSFASATAVDCKTIEWSESHSSGDSFPVGTTSVTVTASDGSNSASCSFDVTVVSGSPTIQNCPADILVTTFSMGQATVTWTEPTATSGCMSSLAVSRTTGPAPGSTFDVVADNPTTITYTTDPDPETGQQASCSFTVSFGYAQIAFVSQFNVASVSELAMYIPFTVTLEFVNIPQQSEVGRLWLSDGTNTVNIATSQTSMTFDTGELTTTFIGAHGVIPGPLLVWATVDGSPAFFTNQLAMTLVTGN